MASSGCGGDGGAWSRPRVRCVLKGTEGAGLLFDWTGNERGAQGDWGDIPGGRGAGGTQAATGRHHGVRAALRCQLGAPVQTCRGGGDGHTGAGAGPGRGEAGAGPGRGGASVGRGQRGPRPEPGDPAASYRVGGMELEDPPALAGGPSKKPWDAENVISPLGMPPVKQEAQSFLTIVMMGSWRCLS